MGNEWDSFWRGTDEGTLLGRFLSLVREKVWVGNFVRVCLQHTAKGSVLEAGCGSAMSSILLSKQRGDSITALDISPLALSIVREGATRHQVPLQVVQGDLYALPFADQTFDVVWNSGTMEHFADPTPILLEMRRVGRAVIVILPARSVIWDCFEAATKVLGPKIRAYFNEGYFQPYRPAELRTVMEKAGFNNVDVENIRCLLFPYVAGIGIG